MHLFWKEKCPERCVRCRVQESTAQKKFGQEQIAVRPAFERHEIAPGFTGHARSVFKQSRGFSVSCDGIGLVRYTAGFCGFAMRW